MWKIQPLGKKQIGNESHDLFKAHSLRHSRESGQNGHHFMPFTPGGEDGPAGIDEVGVCTAVGKPGWQRWWIAYVPQEGQVVGHLDLTGDSLATMAHRCELGVGIEQRWRGQGLGQALMETAITFVRREPSLSWLDLNVFAHNSAAIALYRGLGFTQQGSVPDRFRILGQSIDDLSMTLNVDG